MYIVQCTYTLQCLKVCLAQTATWEDDNEITAISVYVFVYICMCKCVECR